MPCSTALRSAACSPKSGFSQPSAAQASHPFITAQPSDVLQGQLAVGHKVSPMTAVQMHCTGDDFLSLVPLHPKPWWQAVLQRPSPLGLPLPSSA